MIVGDSHASFLQLRFDYLYKQSVKNNQSQNFPTVVAIC